MNQSLNEIKYKILESNPLFASLEPLILENITEHGQIVHIQPNELIISQEEKLREAHESPHF